MDRFIVGTFIIVFLVWATFLMDFIDQRVYALDYSNRVSVTRIGNACVYTMRAGNGFAVDSPAITALPVKDVGGTCQ